MMHEKTRLWRKAVALGSLINTTNYRQFLKASQGNEDKPAALEAHLILLFTHVYVFIMYTRNEQK